MWPPRHELSACTTPFCSHHRCCRAAAVIGHPQQADGCRHSAQLLLMHSSEGPAPAGRPGSRQLSRVQNLKPSTCTPGYAGPSHLGASVQIFIKHCGTCQFRGVPELQSLYQLSSGALAGRTFAPGVANPKKATPVGAAKGLQAVLILDPQDPKVASWAA